jgi:hypothetical protein
MSNYDIVLWFLACIFVFKLFLLWSNYKLRLLEEDLDTQIEELRNKFIFLRVEEHNGIQFAYNATTNEFVCQGKTFNDLNENFGKRFPNVKGILVKDDEALPT